MENEIKWALFHVPKSEVVFVAETKTFIEDTLDKWCIYIQNGVYFYTAQEDFPHDEEEAVKLDKVEFDLIKIQVLQSTDTVFSYKVLEHERWAKSEINQLFASRLNKEQFAAKMAERGTHIITPDMATTMEYRTDQSRFFVKVDFNGIVVGGDFG